METREQLTKEIEKAADAARGKARKNYFAAYFFTLLSVGGSIGATVLAASSYYSGVTAIVAAIPAAVLSVSSAFRFERKSSWHWKKVKLFQGLIRALRYEGEEVAVISREFSKIDGELDQEWVRFGGGSGDKSDSAA